MLQRDDGIEVPEYFRKRLGTEDFLGFLPVLDDALTYFTVENIGSESKYVRVTPIYGQFSDAKTDIELWYEKDISKKAREDDKLQHEYYRDDVLSRVATHKYCVWFLGCDDADTFMRFIDKEHALQYLNTVEFFDEVYESPTAMIW